MRLSFIKHALVAAAASKVTALHATLALAQPAPAPVPAPAKPAAPPAALPPAAAAPAPAAPKPAPADAARPPAPTTKGETGAPPNPPPKPGENPLPPSGPPAAVPEAPAPVVAPAAAASEAPAASAEPAPPVDPNAPPPPDPQSLADDLQGLRTDVENFKFQWQRERDIHTAITTRALTIGGTVQARFGFSDQAISNGVNYNRKTTFDVPTALLNFNGNLYKDYEDGRNLSYQLSFGVSQQTNSNNSFLNLLNAAIVYSVLPTTSPEYAQLTITVGQQLLPFGLEVPASEELKPVIRNAQFTGPPRALVSPTAANPRGVTFVSGYNLGRRDVGAIVRGDLGVNVDYGYNYRQALIAYAFGVLNGAGPNRPDDNNNKDVIARVAFTVPSDYNSWLRQVTFGGSAYFGKQNLYTPDNTLQGKGIKRRIGGDIYYNHWPFGLTYEYIRGKDAVTPGPNTAPARKNVDSDSHTGTFFLSFGEQFVAGFRNQGRYDDWWPKTYQPFLRYDRFNPDLSQKGDDSVVSEIYTAGLNIFFAETTKFQLNYNHSKNRYNTDAPVKDPRATVQKRDSNEVLAQIQFGF